jgi:hypothetical protein
MLMRKSSVSALVLVALVAATGAAQAMTLSSAGANIVDLLTQSNDIVVGRVASVTDGLDERGIPYTEVTLVVAESVRGTLSGDYTFRQFGLIAPRVSADGTRRLLPAPAGFPTYSAGEQLVLFLRPAAAWTGFRMPAGITHGKFVVGPGRVANESANAGLFSDLRLEAGLATAADERMIAAGGPANPDTFLSFVRRAVEERWVERGRMTRAGGHDSQPSSGLGGGGR